ENTSLTIFSDSFITDSIGFIDKNYVNVNAHELAHQWFGNLVTAKSGEHHWLQEGFATYYALLAERKLFGDDYYYWQLFEYAEELIRQDKAGKGTSLLNPKSSSVTFYKKGAWALHMLREQVGEKDFRKGVKKYLKKHQYKNVETLDFLTEMEEISGQDLTLYASEWLLSKQFNHELAYNSLSENKFAEAILQMQEFDDNSDVTTLLSKCDEVLHAGSYFPLQQELFSRVRNVDSPAAIQLYQAALRSNDIKKRQAVALWLKEIPPALKADYESLLNDKSYVTVEAALYNLWNNFPEDQEIYLEQTKNIIGFRDKNVRTLWLVLAILTDNDELGDSDEFFKELNSYTSPNYHFEVRQNAFNYLRWIRSCKEECQENLRNASQHHNWRFKQFVKRMLENH
ncbi:MAG: M1 family peptidase, partial [Flavobacteriaceae bacterium]|nr:M1 family peptidase [Flavobacteriaceae bacterium]